MCRHFTSRTGISTRAGWTLGTGETCRLGCGSGRQVGAGDTDLLEPTGARKSEGRVQVAPTKGRAGMAVALGFPVVVHGGPSICHHPVGAPASDGRRREHPPSPTKWSVIWLVCCECARLAPVLISSLISVLFAEKKTKIEVVAVHHKRRAGHHVESEHASETSCVSPTAPTQSNLRFWQGP